MTQKGQFLGGEGSFKTEVASKAEVETGERIAITATSALVSGSVDPDGQVATYCFELGVYAGSGTQYGTVFSGSAGADVGEGEESLGVSGLQPGTTYVYRIRIQSGYGESIGATGTFTTAGVPDALQSPPPLEQLAVPLIEFPKAAEVKSLAKCKDGYRRNKHGKCVKGKKRGKTKRAGARHRG
jgi:hypothetical protein